MADDRKCAPHLADFYGCLGRSGSDLSQCERELGALTKCSDTDKKENYCVREVSRLLRCTRSPDATGCAKEFITFRECHRPGGAEIIIRILIAAQDNMYKVSSKHLHKYNLVDETICPVAAPARDKGAIGAAVAKLRAACGFKNFEENFSPKVKI